MERLLTNQCIYDWPLTKSLTNADNTRQNLPTSRLIDANSKKNRKQAKTLLSLLQKVQFVVSTANAVDERQILKNSQQD